MNSLCNLFVWTVGTSVAATLIGLVVWLILGTGGRVISSQGRCWLWSLVLLRLVLPTVPGTRWSPFNWLPAKPLAAATGGAGPAEGTSPALLAPERDEMQAALGSAQSRAGRDHEPHHWQRSSTPPWWLGVAAGLWAAGAVGGCGFVLAQQVRFGSRVRKGARVADGPRIRLLADVQAAWGVSGAVSFVVLDGLSSPAVFGLFRPCLLFPRHLLEQLDENQLRHVLMHEMAHVRRRDVLGNWVGIILQCWHWFNPVVWLVVRQLRRERELLCDAAVLSRMPAGERSSYGATLLHLASTISEPVRVAGAVSVLDSRHQHNLERRIRMISKYRPGRRRANAVAALLALVVAGMMFTRAAEKNNVPAPRSAPPADPGSSAVQAQRERGIRGLEEELAKLEAKARECQEAVNQWRDKLQITEAEERTGVGPSSKGEVLRAIEGERINAQARYAQSATLYTAFTNMSTRELKRALPTAYPDPLLNRLLEEQALAEQRMAQATAQLGQGAPEVQGHLRVLDKITQQIEERLEGILRGMQVRLLSEKELVQSLERAAAAARLADIKTSIERTPYYEAKRELERLQFLRERLQARLWQEKIDARMEISPGAPR